ncbi:MAG: sulfatase [Pirellulales bacterium]|nr:sulfatase [Pirellulales bacterium]
MSRPVRVNLAVIGLFFLGCVPLLSTGAEKQKEPEAKKPGRYNVLFIAIDDLRPELGCYGASHMKTPNIDRLASQGTLFGRAYCQQAVCNPSRASLLTGLRPDTTKIYNLSTHFRANLPDVVTLPQHFKNHGYFTQGLCKIYHGGLDDPQSWSVPHWGPRANTYFSKKIRNQIRKTRRELEAKGISTVKRPLKVDPKTGTILQRSTRRPVHGPSWEAPDVPDNTFHDGQTADRAIELLGQFKKQDKPFFLAVGFIRPHLPFVSPKRYFDLYPPESITLADNPNPPDNVPELAMSGSKELRDYADIPEKGPIPEETMRKVVRAYRASASYTDAQVGRVMAELEKQGLRDNTVVVLWGDHGWHLGEHAIWGKMTNFEIATRVPMIISVPGQTKPGARTEALSEFVDIYPTLCDLCGLPVPESLEGTSLVPVMNQPDRPWKKATFSQYPRAGGHMGYTMRTDRYRYTEWRKLKGKNKGVVARELYDYQTDPQGNTNIAGDPKNAQLVADLSRQLAKGWKGALPKTE